jgi:hypothetical protein
MNKIFKILLWFIAINLLVPTYTMSQEIVEERIFDQQKLEKFKNDKNFRYETKESYVELWWKRSKSKFFDWIKKKFNVSFENTLAFQDLLVYLIMILGFVAFAVALRKMTIKNFIFSKPAKPVAEWSFIEDNIHEINFDSEINQALNNENYRLAIRLIFQKTLKYLDENEFITWQPQKTNKQYIYEIKNSNLRNQLKSITLIFEKTWYGEYPSTRDEYEKCKQLNIDLSTTSKSSSFV